MTLPPSGPYCIETVAPYGDHYCIDIVVPSSDNCCTETVSPSSEKVWGFMAPSGYATGTCPSSSHSPTASLGVCFGRRVLRESSGIDFCDM